MVEVCRTEREPERGGEPVKADQKSRRVGATAHCNQDPASLRRGAEASKSPADDRLDPA
jgi:hypothetical protein